MSDSPAAESTPPDATPSSDRFAWLEGTGGIVLLLVLTAAAYARLWGVEFSWDDEALIVDNQVTGSLANIGEFFTRDLWGTTRIEWLKSGYYRPLMLLSLAIDRAIFGLDSTTAHIHSLLWHLGAVGGLWAVLRKLVTPMGALLGATLFALHPLQAEVLALVAARNDSMAAALSLLALWLVLDKQTSIPRLAGAGIALLAGLLSKESAILAPVMLLVLDLARWRRPGPLSRYAALVAGLAIYIGLRVNAGVDEGIVPASSSYGMVMENVLAIAGVYGELLVWPWPLTPARHIHYLAPVSETLLGLVVLLVLLGLALREARPRALALAGLVWAALAWAPTLAATLDKGLLGERYLYFSLAGLGLVLATVARRPPRWVFAAMVIPAIAVLQLRLPQWQDSRTVWEHAHEVDPTPFTAAGLAWYYHRDKDLGPAIELLEMAVKGEPPYRDACDLVLMAALEAKDTDKAVEIGDWEKAQRTAGRPVCRANSLFHHHYAVALAGAGRWEDATTQALNIDGGPSGPSYVVLGAAYARKGDWGTLTRLAAREEAGGGEKYIERIVRLLRLGGEDDAAQRVLEAVARGREAQERMMQQQQVQGGTPGTPPLSPTPEDGAKNP